MNTVETAASSVSVGCAPGKKGLKTNVIGYASNVVIGVASVAPAYSLAATLGFVVAISGVGLKAPAVLLVSFIPMLCIAFAYRYMNRADPDCGTSFAWVTRALGPHAGWLTGWSIVAADVVVMATLAQIAGTYTFLLLGWQAAANSTVAVQIAGVLWIILMTAICYIGVELNARAQRVLLTLEVAILGTFAVVALVKAYTSGHAGSIQPSLSWFNPFAIGSWKALVDGVLLGVFIYWGWDTGVAVNEESENSAEGPGKAAVVSTLLLLLIYIVVSAGAQAYAGPHFLVGHQEDVLSALGSAVFGSGWGKLLILAVLTSAAASTQTTIMPSARLGLSMSRWGSIPGALGRVHPRFRTPAVATILMGVVSTIWFVIIVSVSTNVLGDCVTALGLLIAFYYGLTGLACVVYYRRTLLRSPKNFFYAGLLPFAGFLMLTGIFVKALIDYGRVANSLSRPVFGIGTPDVIGIGMLLIGVILMVAAMRRYPAFFRQRPQAADVEALERPPVLDLADQERVIAPVGAASAEG
jgi:amino acid transporter